MLPSGKIRPYPANIKLGWKGLPETNTLAYYKNSQITAGANIFGVKGGNVFSSSSTVH
jgi:hypothetical protein